MTRILLALAAGVALLSSVAAHAARQSAAQCTSDGEAVLINKAVGDETWVVTYDLWSGYTTGNVLSGRGVDFLSCRLRSIGNGTADLLCAATAACTATSCPAYGADTAASVPCSFFSAPCRRPLRGPTATENSLGCGGSSTRYPYDSEASCIAFAESLDCARYEYTGQPEYGAGYCTVDFCCSGPLECPL